MSTTSPENSQLSEQARRHLWMHFSQMAAYEDHEVPVMVRGEGAYVWDQHGKRYLDGLAGLFTSQLGHGRTELADAGAKQAGTLAYFPLWTYAHPRAIELAERIAGYAPGDLNRVFFTSGGSEAVESAWKVARQYFRLTGQPQRTKVISRNIAYHGTTMGALSITGLPGLKTPFEPLVPGAIKVPNTNFYRAEIHADDEVAFGQWAADEIERAIEREGSDTVAAVFLEPVQNAGGCFPPPPGYFDRVRQICDRHGVLLVSDEVICAFGRLGHWFGSERYGYQPDIITVAKGLTSGYAPLGAMIASDRLMEPFLKKGASFLHGFTFAGHPVSCAVALANLDVFEGEQILAARPVHRGRLPGRPRNALRPAHRGQRARGGLLLRDRAGQGQGHPGVLHRRGVRAPAARLPLGRPVRGRVDLPGRRPGRPGGAALAPAHLRPRGDRLHGLHPARGAERGVAPDVAPGPGSDDAYRGLSLWWDAIDLPLPARPALDGDLTVDVCIVGAGFTGLWTALALAQADPTLRIAVLEREVAGFGASGRNGGWCSALFATSDSALARRYGTEAMAAMRRAMRDTIDVVGRQRGGRGHRLPLRQGRDGRRGPQRQPAGAGRGRDRRGPFPRVRPRRPALARPRRDRSTDRHGGRARRHFQPALRRAPARAVGPRPGPGRRAPGRLPVRAHRGDRHRAGPRGRAPQAHTRGGTVTAEVVVRAVEGWTPTLPGYQRALVPVYSLMVATEPLDAAFWEQAGLAGRATFADYRHMIIYGQRTADDRIAFGGRGAPYHFGSAVRPSFDAEPAVHQVLRQTLIELFPALASARFTHAWGGPLGIPRDWHSSVGLDRDTGLAWAGGYVGDGVSTTNLAGRTLADLITGVGLRPGPPALGQPPLAAVGARAAALARGERRAVDHEAGRPDRGPHRAHQPPGRSHGPAPRPVGVPQSAGAAHPE